MRYFKKMLAVLFVAVMITSLVGCRTPKEQEEFDTKTKAQALALASEYFGEEFEYSFDFYGGGGEGDPALDVYVFKNDDGVINCVLMPAKNNTPGPYVAYNCELHEYGEGNWAYVRSEKAERVEQATSE